MIKQGENEKVEIYYERILKLANCLQHQTNDNLLTTFFQVWFQSYLRIAMAGMKRDTLLEQKVYVITCEESMGDANEY
jgi:hypothetical protein